MEADVKAWDKDYMCVGSLVLANWRLLSFGNKLKMKSPPDPISDPLSHNTVLVGRKHMYFP